jgi:Ca-activated chloride channel family protein
MRFHTYQKFSPEAADAVDLQALLDKLADFLLQSGFAGGQSMNPYFDDFDSEPDRSVEALRQQFDANREWTVHARAAGAAG